MTMQPITIFGYDSTGGLYQNKKPFLIPEQAFTRLENAYSWRDRIEKREGIKLLGRLTRVLTSQSLGTTVAGPPNTITFTNIFSTLSIPEANPEIEPGTLVITVGAPDTATFTDNGDGTFTVTGSGVAAGSYINYVTGKVVLQFTSLTGGGAITANLSYHPCLPVMGISLREIATINDEQTIWFDTTYAYVWNGSSFQEFIPGTTWAGSNSDFFWTTNYRGVNPQDRLFFATNFLNDASDPMRYTDGSTWTTFAPAVDASNFLFQARVLIPYFGRLLALNVWEGATVGAAVNIFNRCRFSQVGNPVASNAWRSDEFGLGGFIDAPTNEQIISVTFLNNTLIVFFERTTWQLRYVGEYGLPFIWERIASDLGSESTFSPVLFNENILAVGDKAIIGANSNNVNRIDLQIPDQIFDFQNAENGVQRVHGVRNYQKELVYWCYADSNTQAGVSDSTIFPNRVLLYNYRNNTWAIFRDNVTAFGTFQSSTDITWDSQTIYWDDENITWDDFDNQSRFPLIVSGNQQGYVHYYQYSGPQGTGLIPIDEQPSLYVTNIYTSSGVLYLTIPNHNLATGEWIFLIDLMFLSNSTFAPVSTSLNNNIYRVTALDPNTVALALWNFELNAYATNFPYTPNLSTVTYIGGGQAAILQNIAVQTKDFNPFQGRGNQIKLTYVDFLMDVPDAPKQGLIQNITKTNPAVITSVAHGLFTGQQVTIAEVLGMVQMNTSAYYYVTVIDANNFSINVDSTNYATYEAGGIWTILSAGMSVQIYLNSSLAIFGNLAVGNREVNTYGTPPFYGPASEYAWYRFYAACVGQYMRFLLTYDDILMNTLTTHQQLWRLNAMNIWVREAGKIMF